MQRPSCSLWCLVSVCFEELIKPPHLLSPWPGNFSLQAISLFQKCRPPHISPALLSQKCILMLQGVANWESSSDRMPLCSLKQVEYSDTNYSLLILIWCDNGDKQRGRFNISWHWLLRQNSHTMLLCQEAELKSSFFLWFFFRGHLKYVANFE